MASCLKTCIIEGTPRDVRERYERLDAIAEASDFGDLDNNVVVIDTETTGLSFTHDELIQIAAARLVSGEPADWFVTFVRPRKAIPDDIVHLTHITNEDVACAPEVGEALSSLVAFVGNATLVAHNVDFDRHFTTSEPEGYPLLENVWVDSLDLSRIALPRLKSHRLIDLVKAFDAPQSTHRADDDVAATCVVYRRLLAAATSMPRALTRYIGGMADCAEWQTGAVFRYLSESLVFDGERVSPLPAAPHFPRKNAQDSGWKREMPHGATGAVADQGLSSGHGSRPTGQTTPEDRLAPFSLEEMRRPRVNGADKRTARIDADKVGQDPTARLAFPDDGQLDDAFAPTGLMGAMYNDYEPRPEQRAMATAIRDSFAASAHLIVEAGTGVGKSMGYLVPAVLAARSNGIGVGVATNTNSLLDQLVYSELPALGAALRAAHPEEPMLTYAPLKGITHYPCLRKIARVVDEGPGVREVAGRERSCAPALAALLSYIEQVEFDDLDSLKIDYRLLPRWAITTTSRDCLRHKCPYFKTMCFPHGMRRRAEAADVVVTNHALFFCDLAADGGLLPPIRYWVVDEAHAAEEEARRAFTKSVGAEDLASLVARLGASASHSVYRRAERRLANVAGEGATLFHALVGTCKASGAAFAAEAEEFAPRIKSLLALEEGRRGRGYERVELWLSEEARRSREFVDLAARANRLIELIDAAVKANQDLVAYLEEIEEAAAIEREIASAALDLKDVRDALELIFLAPTERYVYQASLNRKKDRLVDTLDALLLDVGATMRETLYERAHSVVFASATLSVNGGFDAFKSAMGLDAGEVRASELMLDSSFDFDNNMVVYVVKDMPEPNAPGYLKALQRFLIRAHEAQGGSMLTLFTNRREMENCFDEVSPALKDAGLRLVCQKWGISTKGLRDDFLADDQLSLFALRSFWQGFDAPGSTLRGVIIPKLPFARPTDPLYCERARRDERAWFHYVLPKAVIETKQAAGRLIRKADDAGVVVLADRRLITKRYGKAFLNSLQSKTVKVCTADQIVEALAAMTVL